ncbi:MAG: hypothetical protein SH850_10095 [Planctomycetaceae bacterium]|nr:hypothetical protein [Planctomycetaceae bacterium]
MSDQTWIFVVSVTLTILLFRVIHVLRRPAETAKVGAIVLSIIGTATWMLWSNGAGAWPSALLGVWAGAAFSSLALANFSIPDNPTGSLKRWLLAGACVALVACGALLLEPGDRPVSLLLVALLLIGTTVTSLVIVTALARMVRISLSAQTNRS